MFRCKARKYTRSEAYFLHRSSNRELSATPHMDVFRQYLRHFENLHSRRRLELEHFLRKSRIDGNIGKFQSG